MVPNIITQSIIAVLTTVICPYLNGIVLETTVLGRLYLLRDCKNVYARQLFLGFAIWAILFIAGYIIPQLSAIFDGLIYKYDYQDFLGSKGIAYVFIIGVGTFPVTLILLIILLPLGNYITRKDESRVRGGPSTDDVRFKQTNVLEDENRDRT